MTNKELLYVEDVLGHEKHFQSQCRETARQLQDPELRQEFNIVVGQTVESEEAAGTILRQDPAAGSTVKSNNAEITVTVSGGPEVIQMIDVTNQEYLKALATLRDMGL